MKYRYHHRLILLTLLLILAQGCGQKGPLFIPDEPEQRENRLSSGS
jgi:predicted small lipoprotein YifL